ncbi:DUF4123 domain-containing protein [Pseudomonas sp. P5_109]|uniref:DUF4123 domain-containing protein n=1 Tax=Pseudomonas sp. P5_109 TaxID=3043441 RepID=UPI002A35A274|nr:DUF4123 domain-containing protein [Pseudomonas sp. P5_109]WPN29818.1 DUF4123 domain-containing protein [Pseudomonas sp. P5_109]
MTDSLPRQWMLEQQRLGHVLCLVLDSENERDTRQSLLKTCRYDQYSSVYGETQVADLADAGPFVFAFDQVNDSRIDELLKHPQRNWGWFASLQKGDLPTLVKHWRERLIIGARPDQALYRFHDNRVLSRALAHLPVEACPAYLGPAISVCYWQGTRWESTDNPAPGTYPVPDQPLWHQVPAPNQQADEIRLTNARRYLLAEHVEAYANLAEQHDPDMWLRSRLAQAQAWGWFAPDQLEFLLIQSLQAPAYKLAAHWRVRPDESPDEHFERVYQTTAFWQGEGAL